MIHRYFAIITIVSLVALVVGNSACSRDEFSDVSSKEIDSFQWYEDGDADITETEVDDKNKDNIVAKDETDDQNKDNIVAKDETDDQNKDNIVAKDKVDGDAIEFDANVLESESNEQLESFLDEQLGEKRKVDFEGVKARAEKGDAAAQCELGYYYETGLGVERNWKEAFKWYEKSAEQGYGDGQAALGVCYRFGIGTKIDMKKAIEFLQKGVEQDNVKAIDEMAYILVTGFSPQKGMFLDREIVDATDFQNFAGQYLVKYANSDRFGIALAMQSVYTLGLGVEKDATKSEEYFAKSLGLLASEIADRRAVALFKLGKICITVPNENVKAAGYMFIAAASDQGLPDAQLNIGYFHLSGLEGIEQLDKRSGIRLLESAAAQNVARANVLLGTLYFSGEGVQQDLDKALKYFQKGEKLGDCRAYWQLALYYESEGSNSEYAKYFDKAFELGDADAKLRKGAEYIQAGDSDGFELIFEAADAANHIAINFIYDLLHSYEQRDMDFITKLESHVEKLRNQGDEPKVLLANAYQKMIDDANSVLSEEDQEALLEQAEARAFEEAERMQRLIDRQRAGLLGAMGM